MRPTYFLLLFAALTSVGSVAHAKSRTIVADTAPSTIVPIADPTPLPTIAPTPLPTVVPTPLPTAAPTPLPTAVPTPLPTEAPTPMGTPNPIVTAPIVAPTFQPVLLSPPPTNQSFQIPSGPRSDVSVGTPVTGQQVQQAALALTAPPLLSVEQQRMLLTVASHTASSTLADPSSDYSYGMFSGLNRSTTLGLDSLAAILAAAGIYVAVRSGSTIDV